MGSFLVLVGLVGLVGLAAGMVRRRRLSWTAPARRRRAVLVLLGSIAALIAGSAASSQPAPRLDARRTAALHLTHDTHAGPSPTSSHATAMATAAPPAVPAPARTTRPTAARPVAAATPPVQRLASLSRTASGAALPDRHRTPGAVFAGVGAATVCVSGYSATVRHVSDSTRRAVFAGYGIAWSTHAAYEVDHLVPLELGGDNEIANLWPEPQGTNRSGYPRKDRLENHLHALVCAGRLSLRTAQRAVATDWVAAYARYAAVSTPVPSPRSTPRPPARSTAPVATGTGATARCNDGTYSYAAHHQGACSRHGGVKTFYR